MPGSFRVVNHRTPSGSIGSTTPPSSGMLAGLRGERLTDDNRFEASGGDSAVWPSSLACSKDGDSSVAPGPLGGAPDSSIDYTETLPPCPRCDIPVATVISRGLDVHRAVPCRCRLERADLESLD